MAPSRAKQESSITQVAGPSKGGTPKNFRSHPYSNDSRPSTHGEAHPGVQKLKSTLRQVKRLLARDNLAADVRVKSERLLKALEVDLACAEQSRKERRHAAKYHKVKFFERQKVVRKISQTKRRMETSDGKEKEKLKSALADLRVDLNYVLHFPKTMRYVSLFPPEVRSSGSTAEPIAASSDDNKSRSKVRQAIREQMRRGELSVEPEAELRDPGRGNKQSLSRQIAGVDHSTKVLPLTNALASDDFFGDDDERDGEDSQQSEALDC